jgi:hypothetical protein
MLKCKTNLSKKTWAKLNDEEQAVFNTVFEILRVHAHNTAFTTAFDLRRLRLDSVAGKKTSRRNRA